jgi:hypothetical protein
VRAHVSALGYDPVVMGCWRLQARPVEPQPLSWPSRLFVVAALLEAACTCGPEIAGTAEGSASGTGTATSAADTTTAETDTGTMAGCGDGIPVAGEYCFERIDLDLPARHLAVGDFDGDGAPDIVVNDTGSETLRVVLWRPNAEVVVSAPVSSVLASSFDLQVGDFDGDGWTDLAVFGSAAIRLHLGDGAGGLTDALVHEGGNGDFYEPSVALDLEGDGRSEIVATVGPGTRVRPLAWDGAAWVEVGADYLLPGCWVNALAAGDLDGDGRGDLIGMGSAGECEAFPPSDQWPVVTLLSMGDGTFAEPVGALAGAEPMQAIAADLDGDAIRDIVTWNRGSGDFSLLRGLGGGAMAEQQQFGGLSGIATAVGVGDLDGDEQDELLLVQEALYVVEDAPSLDAATNLGVATVYPVVVADFQGDGVDDIAFVDRDSDRLALLLSDP